ncbi:MAG TPA: glycosyltransferase [Thiobacillaceae bacterium]|nr:glycosyltransferase [Thiobacillaceae bacterium]
MTRPVVRSLHVIGGTALGGAERFFVRLVNALQQRKQPVAVVTVKGGEIDAAVEPGVARYHAPMFATWDRYSRWLINRAARDFSASILQTYMGRATRITRLPDHSACVHVARLGGYYNLKGYRHAHAWVGNTKGIIRYLIDRGLPEDRCFYVGNFVDMPAAASADALSRLRATCAIAIQARVLLGLGRFHPNKGWADLLDAFARLPAEVDGRSLHLLMVGSGPLDAELREQARTLDIAPRITWAGWQKDPAPWYQLADVFICASRHEPLGNVILEAWANRTLTVSTRASGPLELMEDGVDGLLAPVADPQALAEIIHTALTLPQAQRAAMIEAGASKLQNRFSEDAIVNQYLDLFSRLKRN